MIRLDLHTRFQIPREGDPLINAWTWQRRVNGAWVTNKSQVSAETPNECAEHRGVWFAAVCLCCSGVVLREYAEEPERRKFGQAEHSQRGAKNGKRSRAVERAMRSLESED